MKSKQASVPTPQEIKLKQLLQYFNRNTHNSKSESSKPESSKSEKRFCFIIGSGASVPSGIPTGGALVRRWVEELKKEFEAADLNTWFKQIKYQDERAAEFYPQVYEKKFEIDPDEGYDELAQLMERKEPSCGYSVLVQILANTQHNVVITTNFDTLTEDAMFTYTDKRPLVCGHESLSGFIRPFTRRPIVAKIHRDLFFAPKNRRADIAKLDDQWVNSLKNIFEYYTPIVIGYGGNDGSLMGFLEKLQLKGIFWCYREADGKPGKKILKLVEQHKGFIVPIEGFDEMMIQLNTQLGFALLDKQILEVAQQKADNYRKQIEAIQGREKLGKDTKEALTRTIKSRSGVKTWWDYELLVRSEKNDNQKEVLYLEGLASFPDNEYLLNNYAYFLANKRKEYHKAEGYYQRALEISPNFINALNNYASLLEDDLKEYDKAEQYYKKALQINPDLVDILNNYARFLENARKDFNEAEKYYQRILEINPNFVGGLNNYARFLEVIHRDFAKAEQYYQKALEIDPNSVHALNNYACLLGDIHKDDDKAEQYYQQALGIEPEFTYVLNNFAYFLQNKRRDYDRAEHYYQKALEIDPNFANALNNYARLLESNRKDYDKAEQYYQKAIEIDPNYANALYNYADLLEKKRKDYDKAEQYYQKAIESDQGHIKSLEAYATFLETIRNDPEKAKPYREKAEALKKQQNQSNT